MPGISLVLSGAVSLGSFEAGVVDELLYVLDALNRERPETERYRIDVITGASAGAMTGALVAQAVMVDFGRRRRLHDAWVDEIDFARLLERIPDNALLSSVPIDRIARDYLSVRADEEAHPSSLASGKLRMTFTVANLSGVDYRLPRSCPTRTPRSWPVLQPAGAAADAMRGLAEQAPAPAASADDFVSTFFAEQRDFEIDAAQAAEPVLWEEVRETAIASGSFPLAFAPHPLLSVAAAFPGNALEPWPPTFWYMDGGVFNNEPLGEAVRLSRTVDAGVDGTLDPDRIFLLVDANLNRSAHDGDFDGAAPLWRIALRAATAVQGEAAANDWLRALRKNNEVAWRDRLVHQIADLVRSLDVAAPGLFLAELRRSAEEIAERKRDRFGEERYAPDYATLAIRRSQRAWAAELEGMGEIQREIFGTLVFLLNSVAGLDKKHELNLHVIFATPAETAGDQLHAFAGFLSREWRQHDYIVGRRAARRELPRVLGLAPDELPLPEDGVAYEPTLDLGSVTLENAPRAGREQLRDALVGKVEAAVAGVDVGPRGLRRPTSWLVRRFVVRKARQAVAAYLRL